MTRGKAGALAVVPGVVALAIAGAGSAAAGPAVHASAKRKATVKADPNGNIAFNRHKLTVRHGKVTIVMKNPASSGMQHGIAVTGNGVHKDGKIVNPGHSSKLKVKLKKGKYVFYCPVLGHRAAGMKGKLIVK